MKTRNNEQNALYCASSDQSMRQATTLGEGSGVEVICERPCRTLGGGDWNLVLPNIHEQIIFIDEQNTFVKSQEFAAAVKASDNYYVIITREDLPNLPYSVDEIYGIHTSGKYHDLKRTYNEMYHIYSTEAFEGKQKPEAVVVEDSNSAERSGRGACLYWQKILNCLLALRILKKYAQKDSTMLIKQD